MTDIVRGTPEATAIITRVVQATGSDPRRRALVLALASDVVYGVQIGRGGAAVDAIRSAEAAGADADPALHRALLNLVVAKVIAGEGLDSDLLDRAARLETRLSTTRLYDTAELTRGLWSRFVEDLETSRTALRRSIIRAADAYDELSQCMFLAYLAGTEALAGDYRAAEDAISEADSIAAWHHWPPSPWQLEPKCELLIAAGDFATALDIVEQLSDDRSSMAVGFVRALVRGKISAWQDDPAAAAQYFERAKWWADQYEWIDPGIRHRLDVVLAEAYVRLGQVEDALRISRTLREIGTRQSRHAVIGDAARIDALAAARRGDLDAAAASAQTAVTAHEASPLRPELVRSLLVLGQIQRRRKARRQASEALGRAHDLATTMGHQPLVAEIERELPRVAGLRSRSSLTATEQRVAELIANGATNRDAATALFVSVRTIESHVATIYRKLGVHSRSELARRFARTALPHDVGQ
jgi:DNA-binding NarL/FixJ family response regulator